MNKFIKLTRGRTNSPVYVNVSNILYFNLNRNVTSIKFGTDKEYCMIGVIETPEEILELINEKNND